MAKFNCTNCNKPFKDMLGAIGCPCQNKIKWNNPRGGRGSSLEREWRKLIKRQLTEESKRHRRIIKLRKLE